MADSDVDVNKIFREACKNGLSEVVEDLLNNGATQGLDINSKEDFSEATGFIWACYYGHTSTVELLLNNADAKHLELNAKEKYGDTGFMLACYKGHTSIVELLLNNADALHLDLTAKTFWLGKTGFQEAQSKGHSDVVELIRAKRPSIAEQRVPRVWVEFENRYILSNGTTNLFELARNTPA